MNDKICPMYKAALLTVERWDEALKAGLAQCDGAECGWWVADYYCSDKKFENCLKYTACKECPKSVDRGTCGRIDG